MRAIATLLISAVMFIGMAMTLPTQTLAQADGYIGEKQCLNCHTGSIAGLPAIAPEYLKNGHRYKLNPVNNGTPNTFPDGSDRSYPDGRLYYPLVGAPFAPAEVTPPAGTSWSDFAYVIGGYGWKARFVRTNGRIYTDDAEAQQNLWNNSRVEYHVLEDKKYDFACFQCHTTGGTADGSWNGVPGDALGTFKDPGVTCEGCHGPGADHQAGAFATPPVLPPNTGNFLKLERCGECHQRGGATNAIPASSNYVKHHEQVNEFRASKHGASAGLTCVSCHSQHVPLHYPDLAGATFDGISKTCESCHGGKKVQLNGADKPIQCIDCHMPKASKSAVGTQIGNGWQGDVKTHIMAINTNPVTREEAMFNIAGDQVALDGDGLAAVTMDFACLQCHSNKNVQWAADHAPSVHTTGIHTASEDLADLPEEFELQQNYPNPFNPRTTIRFDLPETADVTLEIFSVDGRLVQSMLNQTMPAGDHSVEINAEFLPSGNYIYRLRAGTFTQSKTMTLLK